MRSLSVARLWVAGLALVAASLAVGPPLHAATTGPRPPFPVMVADATLVVVARIALEEARITVLVERVLAGTGPSSGRLVFEDPTDPPHLVDGAAAIIAFADPGSIEASAPTIAWHVSDDGFIDPDGLASADGLPPTLAAMYTYFGVPMAPERAGGDGDHSEILLPFVLVLAALALAEGGIAHRERRPRPR